MATPQLQGESFLKYRIYYYNFMSLTVIDYTSDIVYTEGTTFLNIENNHDGLEKLAYETLYLTCLMLRTGFT